MSPAAIVLLAMATTLAACSSGSSRPPVATKPFDATQAELVLFDDFNYTTLEEFRSHGWIARSAPGWPGIAGAVWSSDHVSFLDDPLRSGNRILRMTSSIGEQVAQTQICHARKYLEGTYAARVRFTDTSSEGQSGDEVVQSFYAITPYRKAMDPAYSEIDFEYLPGGGWEKPAHTLMTTTWETTQMDPPKDLNEASFRTGALDGWHTLVFQALDGRVRYYIDGEYLAEHSKPNYPDAPMSLNFNLWFIRKNGALPTSPTRHYVEEIDWVLHAKDTLMTVQQITDRVAHFRSNSVLFRDTVPAATPALDSPCDL
jgi:hypothetical protein